MKISPIKTNFYTKVPTFGTNFKHGKTLSVDTVNFQGKNQTSAEENSEISSKILEHTNGDNFDFAKMIIQDDDFPRFLIPSILKNTNEENLDSRIEAYKFLKGQKGKLKGDYTYALSSLNYVEGANVEILKMMTSGKDFPKSIMWSVLIPINEENKDLAEVMIKDPDFPKERIANILSVVNSSNERIAELLIKKKDFPREKIGLVLSNTNEINAELCEYMLSDCDYAPSEIVEVLRMYQKES